MPAASYWSIRHFAVGDNSGGDSVVAITNRQLEYRDALNVFRRYVSSGYVAWLVPDDMGLCDWESLTSETAPAVTDPVHWADMSAQWREGTFYQVEESTF